MAEPLLLACPACGTRNRVPPERLGAGGTCGKCGQRLFRGEPVTLTASDVDRHAGGDLPLLVDFWAAWCGPCRQMAPVFAAAAGRLEPQLRLGKLDTEAEPAIAARFAVRSIPTLALIRRGRELARTAGAMPLDRLVQWTRAALATAA